MFVERQHGDRRLVGGGSGAARRRQRRPCLRQVPAPDAHRPLDVLEALTSPASTKVTPTLPLHLRMHDVGDEDAARGCAMAFEPGGDVDAVAEDVVALDDDVAEIDADAECRCASARHVRDCASAIAALDLRRRSSTASTALPNSTSAPSPIVLTMRPWCAATAGLNVSLQICRSAASVPASSAPIMRL